MIRPITPDDTPGLIAIAKEIGFEPNELEELGKMFADYNDQIVYRKVLANPLN